MHGCIVGIEARSGAHSSRTCPRRHREGDSEVESPARIAFVKTYAVIVIDTIDEQIEIAMWTPKDLARQRLLRPD